MYKKSTVKAISIIAIVLACVGLFFSIVGTLIVKGDRNTFAFILGIATWSLLLWAAIIGYQLTHKYNLYEEEYKKVGIRIYAIIGAFVLFWFVGLVIGLVLSIGILATLYGLKGNYDDWEPLEPPVHVDPAAKESPEHNA